MRHMNIEQLLVLLFTLSSVACGDSRPTTISHSKEAWNASNDPLRLRDRYEVKFVLLPLQAELERKPWTDSYWPNYRAGLADRWNDPARPDAFSYPLPTREQLTAMAPAALQSLSPAEKYDILQGRLDYPLVLQERGRTSPDDPSWYGLCHGWAPAGLNFDEPHPVTLTSPLGVDIPFGASDVKALLTLIQQYGRNTRILGERCDYDLGSDPSHARDPQCRDTNAGSFHIIISNQIGSLAEGFIADITRDQQVWNQPIFGFMSRVELESADVYENAAPGTVRIVTVATTLRYIAELGANWQPMPLADFPYQEGLRLLRYNLELNASGEIIGGEWLSEGRPDFLWTQARPTFWGYLTGIEAIYEASVRR